MTWRWACEARKRNQHAAALPPSLHLSIPPSKTKTKTTDWGETQRLHHGSPRETPWRDGRRGGEEMLGLIKHTPRQAGAMSGDGERVRAGERKSERERERDGVICAVSHARDPVAKQPHPCLCEGCESCESCGSESEAGEQTRRKTVRVGKRRGRRSGPVHAQPAATRRDEPSWLS